MQQPKKIRLENSTTVPDCGKGARMKAEDIVLNRNVLRNF